MSCFCLIRETMAAPNFQVELKDILQRSPTIFVSYGEGSFDFFVA